MHLSFFKISILGFLFFIFGIQSYAQVAFGLKGGLNLSSINLKDPQASYDSRTGYHAGIFLRSRFEKVAIQPELLLYTQNGDIKSSLFGTAQENFTYLTIPLLLKFYPVAGLNLQVGPQAGFILDGERKYNSGIFGNTSQDITEYYKKSDVAISVGGGYDFGFGLNVDVRYNLGIKDINNVSNGEPAKSRVFMVSVGWNFLK
jgi:hypothetical protein